MSQVVELPAETYKGEVKPDWCPGCGDFGVLASLQKALGKLGLQPKDVMVVSGIGCSSNLPGFIHTYGMHTLHGRAVPVASGVKIANTDLHVIITGGDGDGYGIGLGHFVHCMRRNLNVTYIVMNNQIYGLTTGQTSPTTMRDHKTKSTPWGNLETPINPLALGIISGATFVARGFSGEPAQLSDVFAQAIQHKGFSLVDVFSPCVTYNNTYPFYKANVYKLEDENHDPKDTFAGLKKTMEWSEKRIPIGVFFRKDNELTYEEQDPVLKKGSPVKQKLTVSPEVAKKLVEEFL